jgi:hypothetical protein
MKKVWQTTGKMGISMWSSCLRLDCNHLFADHFEPETTYEIKLVDGFREGGLMQNSCEKLEGFGIDLTNAKSLMAVNGPFDMEEFVTKVAEPEVNPTVLLLEWQPGFVIGGFAGVPWPKDEGLLGVYMGDPEGKSFIFSLEPEAERFDLFVTEHALLRVKHWRWRGFEFGDDLGVFDNGNCTGCSSVYAGSRDDGSFPIGFRGVRFTRFELWAL